MPRCSLKRQTSPSSGHSLSSRFVICKGRERAGQASYGDRRWTGRVRGESVVDERELAQIQIAGADARTDGWSRFDNPFFRPSHAPAMTGDTPALWRAKKAAWDHGFRRGYAALSSGTEGAEDPGQDTSEPAANAPEPTADRAPPP